MAKMIHSMIRVFDLDKSIAFYKTALDLDVAERLDFDGFSLVYLRNEQADFELELTFNEGQEEPYTHGSGYGHIAVCVDDVKEAHTRISDCGLEPADVKEFADGDVLIARFFFLTDPDGYKIEFLEKLGRFS